MRQWFPETLLWRPEVITDDQGQASLEIPLADSITTWRLSASAVAADGRLGASQESIKVFQPFFVDLNLPVALVLNDEIAVPVVVYNYVDRPQEVELTFAEADWYASRESRTLRLNLQPGEVRSASFRLRARRVGKHELQVTARGSGVADAIKREVEVLPGGRRVETVWNGSLNTPQEFPLTLPEDAIEGSGKLFAKIYPSQFSQVVEGLDSIFRLPYGCFEQTTSVTYPNVLALDYLQRTRKTSPAIEAKARNMIHLGYQRLLGFEVQGGGFDWFGHPPANVVLTAYGLMEFEDMAKVHPVDPNLIKRTREWLLNQRRTDGSWQPEGHSAAGTPQGHASDELARLTTTAYVAWSVYRSVPSDNEAAATRAILLRQRPQDLQDPYVLALVCNSLLATERTGADAAPYLARLDALKQSSADGKRVWWGHGERARTLTYGSGRAGSVEATALAVLAFTQAGKYAGSTRGALTWIAAQRDGAGTWYSTQATVLALKAILTGTSLHADDRERRIETTWQDGKKSTLVIPASQTEVMKLIDLSDRLAQGRQTFTLAETTEAAPSYQVVFRYHVPDGRKDADAPLALSVTYDREKLSVGEVAKASATIANKTGDAAPMVMVELPIPAGFTVMPEAFADMVKSGQIAKFEIQPRAVQVYVRELAAGKSLAWSYGLRATMPAEVTVPSARAYEYYNPDRLALGSEARFTVSE